MISPLAYIHPEAKIGENVEINRLLAVASPPALFA